MDQSSHDYNQSVFRTVNKSNPDYFWSSSGSPTPNASEWLTYKVSQLSGDTFGVPPRMDKPREEEETTMEESALITRFGLKVFNPQNF